MIGNKNGDCGCGSSGKSSQDTDGAMKNASVKGPKTNHESSNDPTTKLKSK